MVKINPVRNLEGKFLQNNPVATGRHSSISNGGNQGKKPILNLRDFLLEYKYVLIFAILVALVAGFFSWFTGDKFSVSLAITISRQGSQESADYQYDNYYALRASDEFGDTVAGWLETPEITSAIYAKAGLGVSDWSLNDLSGKFKSAKISPNVIEVRFGAASDSQARQIADALSQVISQKVNELENISNAGIDFSILAGQPVIVKNKFNFLINTFVGFLVGLVFGFFVAAAKNYL